MKKEHEPRQRRQGLRRAMTSPIVPHQRQAPAPAPTSRPGLGGTSASSTTTPQTTITEERRRGGEKRANSSSPIKTKPTTLARSRTTPFYDERSEATATDNPYIINKNSNELTHGRGRGIHSSSSTSRNEAKAKLERASSSSRSTKGKGRVREGDGVEGSRVEESRTNKTKETRETKEKERGIWDSLYTLDFSYRRT